MQINTLLRYTLVTITAVIICSFCNAQNNVRIVDDSTSLNSYSTLRGDTLFIAYDSAYILNKATYKLYRNNYLHVLKNDLPTKRLIDSYEELISKQDSMLKEKESYYQSLKQNFDTLTSVSSGFADRTDARVKSIDTSLVKVTENLTNIRSLLDDSLEKLKAQNRQKLKIAIGGFTIGVGVTGLIFLLVH